MQHRWGLETTVDSWLTSTRPKGRTCRIAWGPMDLMPCPKAVWAARACLEVACSRAASLPGAHLGSPASVTTPQPLHVCHIGSQSHAQGRVKSWMHPLSCVWGHHSTTDTPKFVLQYCCGKHCSSSVAACMTIIITPTQPMHGNSYTAALIHWSCAQHEWARHNRQPASIRL